MTSTQTFEVTRAWRYDGYEGGIEDGLILVDGQQIGGTYHCVYNPNEGVGWGWNDGGQSGETWASYGPRGYSFGHATREGAEMAQVREYVANPSGWDRIFEQNRAEKQAEQDRREAEETARIEAAEAERARTRLGDDEPGPVIWRLPAYHGYYAPVEEASAVAEWLKANDITGLIATFPVTVEQRETRRVIVFETETAFVQLQRMMGGRGRSTATETHVVTLVTEPPAIATPERPELHPVIDEHWPAQFPLIDFGAEMACGTCTKAKHSYTEVVPWPCQPLKDAIGNQPDPAPSAPCLRCGHKLSAPSSINRKYSLRCWRLELADRRAAALELAIVAWSDQQKADAKALIKAGRLEPTKRRGRYEVTSSDKVTVYRTTALTCGCSASQHLRLCYHRAAAAIADAYLEFGETVKAAA